MAPDVVAHEAMTASSQPTGVFSAETRGVRISVTPSYLPAQSSPRRSVWMFAYEVEIANLSAAPVQLIARHWIITDGMGREEEVMGLGVVGEQPRIEPGGAYSYNSGCPLTTPTGSMRGTYRIMTAGGPFDAAIPEFPLRAPESLN